MTFAVRYLRRCPFWPASVRVNRRQVYLRVDCTFTDSVVQTASVILDLHSMYLSLLHLGAAQSLDFASFQAIIKELLQAISVLKIGKADPLEKLLNSVSSADKSLDLSTGHALQAIWKAALVPRSNNSTIEQIQQLASRIEVDGVSSGESQRRGTTAFC